MSLPSFRLDGQVALVTGASRGIGRAILHALAASGATVVGTATTESGAAAISTGLAEAGLSGRGLVLNVTDEASVEAALKNIEAAEGAVGILVNNAGITRDTLLLRMKTEDWDAILNTNLTSVFRLSKAVLRGMMKARTGRIISIASIVGQIGNAGQANYAAAKAGIIGFTRPGGGLARHHRKRRGARLHRYRYDPRAQRRTALRVVGANPLGTPRQRGGYRCGGGVPGVPGRGLYHR